MTAIKITGLKKEYKDVAAVDGLDLQIEEGELFALLGVNGAGKTTTVKMLSTLAKPSGGDAFIFGASVVSDPDKIKGIVDISTQETAVARNLTVEENVRFYAKLSGQSKAEIKETEEYIYKAFDLKKIAKKRAGKLSGGYQRKLSVALALVTKPKILFLDEPTLGLDVLARRELWSAIRALKGRITIILTTHYMEEAEELADRIGIMKDGKLLFCGNKEELFEKTGKKNVEEAFIETVTGGGADE